MRLRLGVVAATVLGVLALAAPSFGAYSDPVIEHAKLTVVKKGIRPTWKVTYLLCYQGSGTVQVQVSEFSYVPGAKFKTLQVQTRGGARVVDPSDLGGTGTCAWYRTGTYHSKFAQRAGRVTGVTVQVWSSGSPDRTQTRTFRLNP